MSGNRHEARLAWFDPLFAGIDAVVARTGKAWERWHRTIRSVDTQIALETRSVVGPGLDHTRQRECPVTVGLAKIRH
ncbi:hypothetical protein BH23CHL5_BH23CHL5_14210 [soil metagenome]